MSWVWPLASVAKAIHDEQLAEHGGGRGVRDENALLSALARAQNIVAYGDPDAPALAATYAFGIARNHPFTDGNKRTAWAMARLFLDLNGAEFTYTDEEAIMITLALAAGELSEDDLADWFRERIA